MQTKPLEPGVEITSALAVDELEEVKARGFHAVVCNRIEGESEDFPDEARYREKAMALIFQVNPCRMGRRKQLRQIALLVLTLGVGPQVRGPLT